jgi:ketosteroid isomerase-like protein
MSPPCAEGAHEQREAIPVHRADVSQADLDSIASVAHDYYDAWFEGDPERMAACLHPRLVKRVIDDPAIEGSTLSENSWESMVRGAEEGRGTGNRGAAIEVSVLDAFRNIASVRVAGGPYVDHLHVGRFGDRWRIVNALWEPRSRD